MKNIILSSLATIFVLIIFHSWFSPGIIAGGDLEYFWNYDYFSLHPFAWNIKSGEGLGVLFVPFLWIYMAISVPINIVKFLNLPWDFAQRLIFFYPFIAISIFSSVFLSKKIIPNSSFYILAPLVFVTNTYILNIVQGGQLVFALAYALSPMTLLLFMKLIEKSKPAMSNVLLCGLILSLQTMVDIRVAYMLIAVIFFYFLADSFSRRSDIKNSLKRLLPTFILPGIIVGLVNAFWILPSLTLSNSLVSQLGMEHISEDALSFFSFANLENSISLLHPNWPENIFGKIYFMRPEFLIVPILAFSALFFINKLKNLQEKVYILYFSLLGLIGAFLAKGVNEPFGGMYIWLFENIPGFVMFRDPTKWYILVAISYSILIPYSIEKIYFCLKERFK